MLCGLSTGTPSGMTSLVKLTSKTKRAATVGLLLGLPLMSLAACGDGGDSGGGGGGGGGSEVENSDTQEDEDDGGIY